MSDFISAIKPWIEDAAFDAIVHSNSNSNSNTNLNSKQEHHQQQKIRFVQVLQRKSASCVIISDCKTQVLCRTTSDGCNDNIDNSTNNGNIIPQSLPTNIQRGSVVKLKDYNFVLNSDIEQNPTAPYAIELVTDSVEFAGAQGMGIIGDPIDLMETVQVRRALQHIHHDIDVLKERLSLARTSRVDKGKKRGDALALLRQEKLLDQLFLGDEIHDDDDDGGDNIETQDVLIMTQECQIQHKRKDVALQNDDNGTTKKKFRKGNVLALLGDDAKLERVLGMRADGDGKNCGQQVRDNHGPRRTENIDDGANGSNEEYVTTLKDPPPRASPLRKRTKVASLLETESMPLPAVETHQHVGADNRLEHGQKRNDDDEDDAGSSASSDPVGISEMLSSPKSRAPDIASKEQLVDKMFQIGLSITRDSTTATTEDDASMPIASISHQNRQQSGANDFMQRWRRTRTFYKRLWEQRHEKVVIFS